MAFLFFLTVLVLAGSPANTPERISLRYRQVALSEALADFREATQLDMVFAEELMTGISLSFDYRERTPHEMLRLLLKDTGLVFKRADEGRVVIYPMADEELFSLAGFVISPTGPLAGAILRVVGSARQVVTDERGAFSLPRLPRHPLQLRIGAEGHGQITLEVDPEREHRDLSVLLVERPFLAEQLVVSQPFGAKTRNYSGGNLEIAKPEEVISRGSTSHDLFQGLRAIPGVDVGAREGGVSFRGARPSENLVLLEGIKLYQLDHALGYFSALNPDAISEVSIYKGAYPALYGDRVAGVLDIRAKGDRLGIREIRAGFDRDLGHATVLLPLGYRAALMVSARQSHSDTTTRSVSERLFASTFDEEQENFDELDNVRTARDFRFEDQMLRLTWRPNGMDSLSMTLFRSRDESKERVVVREGTFMETAFAKDGDWGNDGAGFRWSHQWSSNHRTGLQVSRSQFKSHFFFDLLFESLEEDEVPRFVNRSNQLEENAFQITHNVELSEYRELTFGVFSSKIELEWLEANSLEEPENPQFQTRQNGLFWQFKQNMERLHSLVGFRTGKNELSDSSFLEPRISLSFDVNKKIQIRTSWGRFHQFMLRTPDTINYFEGSPTWFPALEDEIVPGFSEHTQLGARYLREGFLFDFEAYHKLQEGSLINLFDPLREEQELFQIAERYRGFDLRLEKTGEFWFAGLGYSYKHTRAIRDLEEDEPLDFPTDRDRPHTVHLSLSWTKNRWEIHGIGRFTSGGPYDIPEVVSFFEEGEEVLELAEPEERNALRLPDSYQLDARLNYAISLPKGIGKVGISFTNLFDHHNVNDRFFAIEEYEEEEQEIVPVDVLDFGFRMSFDFQVRF